MNYFCKICKLAGLATGITALALFGTTAHAQARVVTTGSICPAGTVESVQAIVNNDFSASPNAVVAAGSPIGVGANAFTSSVPYAGRNVYPSDTSIAAQNGAVAYVGVVAQQPFPGDPTRQVDLTDSWLYANGNTTGAPYTIFERPLTGLSVGTVYSFLTYVTNTLDSAGAGISAPSLPTVQFQLNQGSGFANLGPAFTVANEVNGDDVWTLVQRTFTATATTASIRVQDSQLGNNGDDLGITRLTVRPCVPPTATTDLAITKTGPSTAIVGQAVNYTLTVSNLGPDVATSPVITDLIPSNLGSVSWSCTALGVSDCDTSTGGTGRVGTGSILLNTATIAVGAANALTIVVTTVAGTTGNIVNTAYVSPAFGTSDPNTANNQSSVYTAITTAAAAPITVVSAASLCPAPSRDTVDFSNDDFFNSQPGAIAANGVINSNSGAGTFTSSVNYNGRNVNPGDTSISSWSGPSNGPGAVQQPFPGDSSRGVSGTAYWLQANGNNTGATYTPYSRNSPGLVPGATYTVMAYVSNALTPGSAVANPPNIQIQVNTGAGFVTVAGPTVLPNDPATGSGDTWRLIQATFVAPASGNASFRIQDTQTAGGGVGDTWGLARVVTRQCAPAQTRLGVTKTNNVSSLQSGGTTTYVIVLNNDGPSSADGASFRDVPSAGLVCTSVTCTAVTGGAACPTPGAAAGQLSIANLTGTGVVIPTFPAVSTLRFAVGCGVTATGQ